MTIFVGANGREYLRQREMEEMRAYGWDISVRHMKNQTPLNDLYHDRPARGRDYSDVSFTIKALVRFGESVHNLTKVGLDVDRPTDVAIFSKGLLAEQSEEVIVGDLVEPGDGKTYEIKRVVPGSNEARRIHDPHVMRVFAFLELKRETTGADLHPRT